MLLKIINGVPEVYSLSRLRADNPKVSFPREMDAEFLAGWDVFPFTMAPEPTYDADTERLEPGDFQNVTGQWFRGWNVVTRTAGDLADRRAGLHLSFAQLLIGLVEEQWITEAEGEAWLAGTVPAAVTALIATLPVEQRFRALARATRPSIVDRSNQLVNALAQAQGRTPRQIDRFFVKYASA